jgi:hypothetical protein
MLALRFHDHGTPSTSTETLIFRSSLAERPYLTQPWPWVHLGVRRSLAAGLLWHSRVIERRLAQELDTDFMILLPDHLASPSKVRPSSQMQRELFGEIINVTDCQSRTNLTQVDQYAPFENVIRRSFDPSGLVERSPKEQTPIEKMRVHWR